MNVVILKIKHPTKPFFVWTFRFCFALSQSIIHFFCFWCIWTKNWIKNFFGTNNSRKVFFRSWMETWWKNLNVKCSKIVSLWHLWQKKCNYALWKTSVTPLGLNHFLIFGSTYNSLNLILSNYTFRLRRLNCCVWLPGST